MARLAPKLLAVFGIVVAIFGIGADYILPGSSPGLNLPQLLIIAAGLALALGAWWMGRADVQPGPGRARGKTLAIASVITLATLFALEFVLTISGLATYFFAAPPPIVVAPVDWWICDAVGCHYEYEKTLAACRSGALSGRHCTINRQGFHDSQPFESFGGDEDALRILALGDSFTFGLSAAPGQSFIETLEASLPEAVVWNTGIPGTGTNQANLAFDRFAPLLRPQLTLLGFYMNDYRDNILPVDKAIRALDHESRIAGVNFYFYDAWGNLFSVDRETALRYYGHAVGPPRNRLEHAIGTTRLGSLALRLRDALGELAGALPAKQIASTRALLAELRDMTRARNSELLVILIPRREDIDAPSEFYRASLKLLGELGIPALLPHALLDATADYMPPPDMHWNTAGHQKVGALLIQCVEAFRASGDFAGCPRVILPGGADSR